MKRNDCRQFRDQLVDLIEGTAPSEVRQHVSACAECRSELNQLAVILTATRFSWSEAPSEFVLRAKALMVRRVPVRARLLGSSLLAGARSIEGSCQILVGDDETAVRLMVSETESGWEVLGRLPGDDWSIDGQSSAEISDGGFRFQTEDLGESGFILLGPESEIEVPALSELIDHVGR